MLVREYFYLPGWSQKAEPGEAGDRQRDTHGRCQGQGTEHSLYSRCVDQLHRLVDLEERLEAWRGRGRHVG